MAALGALSSRGAKLNSVPSETYSCHVPRSRLINPDTAGKGTHVPKTRADRHSSAYKELVIDELDNII